MPVILIRDHVWRLLRAFTIVSAFLWVHAAHAEDYPIDPFVGNYRGSIEFDRDGVMTKRNMNVDIIREKDGFVVDWTTETYRADGSSKTKNYSIQFAPSNRTGIYSAAMATSVFGKAIPLDPMKGEPYVWGRIVNGMLTIFSLFVHEDGSYEMQQFDRTLVDDGLQLDYKSVRNGEKSRELSTLLKRQ